MWAEFVCETGKFFQCCFLETIFHQKWTLLKSYWSKGICSIALKYGQWLVLHINNKTVSANFLFFKNFCFKSDFCTITPHFFNAISEMFCNLSLKLNKANRLHVFFLRFGPGNGRRNTLTKQTTKFALACNVQKVIRALAFRSREKFDNSFFPKILI